MSQLPQSDLPYRVAWKAVRLGFYQVAFVALAFCSLTPVPSPAHRHARQTVAGVNECSHYPLPEPVSGSPLQALSSQCGALCPQHKQLAGLRSGLFSLPTQARSDRY